MFAYVGNIQNLKDLKCPPMLELEEPKGPQGKSMGCRFQKDLKVNLPRENLQPGKVTQPFCYVRYKSVNITT